MEGELVVKKIRQGTVIDHIPAGKALQVLRVLGVDVVDGQHVVALVMNVESSKLGRKDIVKIEGMELSREETGIIALIAPTATINIIRDFQVVEKYKVSLPPMVVGRFKCSNPICITNMPREPVKSRFVLVRESPPILSCDYCGRYHTVEELIASMR